MSETWEERTTREDREKKELISLLLSTAKEIASELGDGWELHANQPSEQNVNGWVRLSNPDGRGIRLTVCSYNFRGKVDITGDYDFGPSELGVHFPYGKSRPGISCTLSRGGAALAKEITKRFLPLYNERFAEIAETLRKYTEERDRKLGIAKRLGELASVRSDRINVAGFSDFRSTGPSVEVKVFSNVDLTVFSLTEKQAAEVILLVNSFKK